MVLSGILQALPGLLSVLADLSSTHLGAPLDVTRPTMSTHIICKQTQVNLKATPSVQSTVQFEHIAILVGQLPNTPSNIIAFP